MDMKNHTFLLLGVLALLLAACSPQTATEDPSLLAQPTALATAVQPSATPLAEVASPTTEAAPTEALPPTAIAVATSRGPDLHATDPSTVSLASGQLQLVEFFRFT
jgi:hypothetical protein